MKPGRNSDAVTTLIRWRGFQEARLADGYRRCAVGTAVAQKKLIDAQALIKGLESARFQWMMAGPLDFARLEISRQLEDAAETEAGRRQEEHEAARAREDEARRGHMESRAQTRVAEMRHQRLLASELEEEDKRLFDRMADLFESTRRRKR